MVAVRDAEVYDGIDRSRALLFSRGTASTAVQRTGVVSDFERHRFDALACVAERARTYYDTNILPTHSDRPEMVITKSARPEVRAAVLFFPQQVTTSGNKLAFTSCRRETVDPRRHTHVHNRTVYC